MKNYNDVKQDALDFLRESVVAVLATSVGDAPHAAAVYYDVDDVFSFYFVTKPNTHKSIQIAENPKVGLVVGTGPEKISVQATGTAELVVGEKRGEIMESLANKLSTKGVDNLPAEIMKDLRDQKFLVYKIIPQELVFMNMDAQAYPNSISNKLHQII